MKIGLVTMYTPEIAAFGEKTSEDKADYCAIHNYDFIGASNRLGDISRPPPWDKILLLERHLEQYDWLFWTDADAVIMDFSPRLEDFLDDTADIIITKDVNGINSGNWFLKNSPGVFRFLRDVYKQEDLIHHIWWEQAAMMRLIENRPDLRIKYLDPVSFNSYHDQFSPGDFMLHFAGICDKGNLVTQARYSSSLSVECREEFPWLFRHLNLVKRGAEIGVQNGDFAAILNGRLPTTDIFLIDHWRHDPKQVGIANVSDSEQEVIFRSTSRRFENNKRIRLLRQTSVTAASQFDDGYFDWVYIDASHDYESVKSDLNAWYRKVRKGGVLCGHDFLDGNTPAGIFGVKSAVMEFAAEKNVFLRQTQTTDWPSWYFVKRT